MGRVTRGTPRQPGAAGARITSVVETQGIRTKSQVATPNQTRCSWARTPLSIAYHDAEWGVPVHDDRVLFEFLTL